MKAEESQKITRDAETKKGSGCSVDQKSAIVSDCEELRVRLADLIVLPFAR